MPLPSVTPVGPLLGPERFSPEFAGNTNVSFDPQTGSLVTSNPRTRSGASDDLIAARGLLSPASATAGSDPVTMQAINSAMGSTRGQLVGSGESGSDEAGDIGLGDPDFETDLETGLGLTAGIAFGPMGVISNAIMGLGTLGVTGRNPTPADLSPLGALGLPTMGQILSTITNALGFDADASAADQGEPGTGSDFDVGDPQGADDDADDGGDSAAGDQGGFGTGGDADVGDPGGADDDADDGGGGDGGGGGGWIICSELYRQKRMTRREWLLGARYMEHLSDQVIRGYHWWGTPYVRMLRKSPRLSAVSAHIGKARAGEIARINDGLGWTIRGRAAKWLVEGVSWVVGYFVGETDWEGILHERG